MASVGDCYKIVYREPTPMWFHSYSYDNEGRLRRSSDLATRREVLLRQVRPEVPQTCKVGKKPENVEPVVPEERFMMDVADPRHHTWSYQTQTSSQEIGWFSDPKRLPKCKLREWPKFYRNV